MIRAACIVGAMALLAGTFTVRAESPGAQLPIRWENIESSLAGVTPVRVRRLDAEDVLSLLPDAFSILELPPNTWLRIEAVAGQLSDVEVSSGDGTGLFLPTATQALGVDRGLSLIHI